MKPRWEQTKLERATAIAQAFESTQRVMWSSMWPLGHCMVSSLCLVSLIRAPLEWEALIAVGSVCDGRPHAWIESPAEDIIDSTYGMFDGGPALRVLPSERSHELGHRRALLLTLEQEARYRGAIKPSLGNGWDPAVDIMTLFGPNPHVSPALKL